LNDLQCKAKFAVSSFLSRSLVSAVGIAAGFMTEGMEFESHEGKAISPLQVV
jgi:hypothetical protein